MKTPEFTSDWFSGNIPRFEKYVLPLKSKGALNAMEIGSWEGRSAIWLLENLLTDENSKLVCIDTWKGSNEAAHDAERNNIWDRFNNNLEPYSHKMIALRGNSMDILRDTSLHPTGYDFIYVDGSHVAKDVLVDGVLSFDYLKVGGVMVFDDYLWGLDSLHPLMCPKPGIDAFLHAYGGRVKVLESSYQLIVEKIAE